MSEEWKIGSKITAFSSIFSLLALAPFPFHSYRKNGLSLRQDRKKEGDYESESGPVVGPREVGPTKVHVHHVRWGVYVWAGVCIKWWLYNHPIPFFTKKDPKVWEFEAFWENEHYCAIEGENSRKDFIEEKDSKGSFVGFFMDRAGPGLSNIQARPGC